MRVLTVSLIVSAALAVVPAAASAATLTCGQTITQDTRLDNDLLSCPGDGIFIEANDVTLDLNGHVVDGSGSGVGVLWYDQTDGSSHSRITVTNGTIRQFGTGLAMLDDDHLARGLTIVENGTGVVVADGEQNAIADSTIARNRNYGIFVNIGANRTRIASNTLADNGTGLHAHQGTILIAPRGVDIVRNRITGSRGNGIEIGIATSGVFIEGNVVSGNSGDGIWMDQTGDYGPSRIGANSLLGNGGHGINFRVPGQPGVEDLGGNQAQGNGDSVQCVYIACDRSGRALFGEPVHGPSFSQMSGEAKRATPFVFAYGGTVNRVSAFIDGGGATTGTQKIRALLYDRAPSGGPGRLLARSFDGAIKAGGPGRWVNFYFVFPPKLPPGLYWIGLQTGQTGGIARFAWTSSPTSRWFNIDNYDDGATSPFGPSPVDAQRMSIYASGSY